jgi:hypothetical protein
VKKVGKVLKATVEKSVPLVPSVQPVQWVQEDLRVRRACKGILEIPAFQAKWGRLVQEGNRGEKGPQAQKGLLALRAREGHLEQRELSVISARSGKKVPWVHKARSGPAGRKALKARQDRLVSPAQLVALAQKAPKAKSGQSVQKAYKVSTALAWKSLDSTLPLMNLFKNIPAEGEANTSSLAMEYCINGFQTMR